MKRLFLIALAGLLFLGVFSAPAVAGRDIVKVMTRNQYLGADLTPLVTAGSPEDFLTAATAALQQIAANNFPLRARRLATEVALTRPDLIGLQEVYDFTVNNANIGPPFVNHLQETLDALAAKGQSYVVAATVKNLDTTIPFDVYGDPTPEAVRVVDRDVILVREGVDFTPLSGDFTDDGLCGVPIENPAFGLIGPAYLHSTSSENEDGVADGCNYTIVAEVPSLIDPENPIIIDIPIPPYQIQIIPPYQIIADVETGLADVWDTNPLKLFDRDGFTCCELGDLSNTTSEQDERIDIIFVRDTSFRPLAFVTGRVPIFPLGQPPNWASDHGGVFAKLIFRPMRRR